MEVFEVCMGHMTHIGDLYVQTKNLGRRDLLSPYIKTFFQNDLSFDQ